MSAHQRAFTLVEVLVAVSIFILAVGAVFTLYISAIRAGQRTEQNASSASPEVGLARLIRDLTCAVQPESEDLCSFRLEKESVLSANTHLAWRLTFCTTTPMENPADPRWYGIERVAYRWSPNEPTLVRTAIPLAGDPTHTPQTNVLAQRIDGLAIQLHDGSEWRSAWPTGAWPRAARVIWEDRGRAFTAETFVAAGLTFKPSIAPERR